MMMATSDMPEATEQLYVNLCTDSEHESNDDSSREALSPGPSKKARGAAVYKIKFNKDWTKEWLFIREVPNNIMYSSFIVRCSQGMSAVPTWKKVMLKGT